MIVSTPAAASAAAMSGGGGASVTMVSISSSCATCTSETWPNLLEFAEEDIPRGLSEEDPLHLRFLDGVVEEAAGAHAGDAEESDVEPELLRLLHRDRAAERHLVPAHVAAEQIDIDRLRPEQRRDPEIVGDDPDVRPPGKAVCELVRSRTDVERHGMALVHQPFGGLGDPGLGLAVALGSLVEERLLGADRLDGARLAPYGTAVGADQFPLRVQLGEVAPHGHFRHAELRGERGARHEAALADHLGCALLAHPA